MTSAINIQENISLAPLTTLKIGGEARFFARAHSEWQLFEGLQFAAEKGLAVFFLGGGSNLLVADNGYDGLVLQIALKGITREGSVVTAAAGEEWDKFVSYCVMENLAGVECLSGIPGFVGATPIQNVGAYGQEVSETIRAVRALDLRDFEIKTLSNAECGFSYRSSIFNSTEKGRYVVTAVTFSLTENGDPALRYADIKKYFEGKKDDPSLKETREAVIEIRARKSMVISAADPNSKSAGSFFKNPIVAKERYEEIQKIAEANELVAAGQSVPSFPAADSAVKIPAAWLIEKSGFNKGYVHGPKGAAGLSQNHTLALINRGNARAEDILSLKREVQAAVFKKFGVELKPEPVMIGFK